MVSPRGDNGTIREDLREEAKGFILERIQALKDFCIILSASAANGRSTPYFGGSYILALQKAFAPWGIDINEEDNPRRRWSQERIKQDAVEFYQRESGLSTKLLRKKNRRDLSSAIIRRYPGKMKQLRRDLELQPLQKTWSLERVEQEALEFYRTEGQLNYKILYKKKRSDLWSATRRHYPGGMKKLQDKLGITRLNLEETILPDQANEELMKFLEARDE